MKPVGTLYVNGEPMGELKGFSYSFASEPELEPLLVPGQVTTTITANAVIGIRAARLLMTRRPRPKRSVTKRLNKMRRELRKDLVHTAGCAGHHGDYLCVTSWVCRNKATLNGEAWPARASVPRSLRQILGRWAGGDR